MALETKMTPNQTNICSTKQEDLNIDLILNNIDSVKGEACLDKVLDYIKINFTKSSKKSIEIIETLITDHEYEYLLDYSNDLFLTHPKIFLDYFNNHKDSAILNSLNELYSMFIPEHNKTT